jgi:hypothetical protein
MVFALAEILCLEEFGEANHLGGLRSIGNAAQRLREILFWIGAAGHLYQPYCEFL